MVQFGRNPSPGEQIRAEGGSDYPVRRWKPQLVDLSRKPGTLFKASQFLSEELPIRLAHRVKELNQLPDGLNEMPSIQRVANWYMQSFEVGFFGFFFPPFPFFSFFFGEG
jgi:pyruvate dehydrogenase kinase 2/3/4